MNTITGILEGFEKLAYKFLLSIIFLPKTIIQITINPSWVPGYVKGELQQDKNPFDEYLSPVILLLVVALIPALVFSFLPAFGVNLTSPAEGEPTTDPFLIFEAETRGKSSSFKIYNEYSWYVEKINEDGTYNEIYRETYDEFNEQTVLIENGGEPYVFDGELYTSLEYPEQNYGTSKDSFVYEFKEPGEYYVNVEVRAYDPRRTEGETLEGYYAFRYVNVPSAKDQNQQVTISGPEGRDRGGKESTINISDLLRKETTIFLALGLLFPPLLFALATKMFRRQEISENMLRESFYSQCYYFSPLSLAIWATYYAWYFFTPDVFFYNADNMALQIILLPALLAFLWFVGTEIQAIAREFIDAEKQVNAQQSGAAETQALSPQRQRRNYWKSVLIVLACVCVLGGAAYLVYLFVQPYSQVQNNLRVFTIFAYPLISALLMLAFCFTWIRNRRIENQRITVRDFAVFVVPIVFAILATNMISFLMMEPSAPPAVEPVVSADAEEPVSVEVQETPTATASPEPPTQTAVPPTEAVAPTRNFYTEEFESDYVGEDWEHFTLGTGKDSDLVIQQEDDHLLFDLGDEDLYVYYMYTGYEYDDVSIKVNAENLGRNNNNVSLVCRMNSDRTEWYEFSVESGGLWYLYAYINGNYNIIGNGGAQALKQGQEINEYAMTCQANEITLYVNDDELITVTDNTFRFSSGSVGLNISSLNVLPITVAVNWFEISQP